MRTQRCRVRASLSSRAPAIRRRPNGRRSSISSSLSSSPDEHQALVPAEPGYRGPDKPTQSRDFAGNTDEPARYRGPEYVAHLEGELLPAGPDPLLHLDPYRPPPLYRFGRWALRFLLRLLFRLEVEGLENIPEPPYIIASNHQRWFDPLFLVIVFPRLPMIYSMAKRETVFNRGWKRAIVRRFGVFAISPSRGHIDEQGVASVYEVLSRRGVVLIFPEGRYSRGTQLRPLKKGVAHFSLQSGVPICPVAITGVDQLKLRGRVGISIGRPIYPTPPLLWRTSNTISRLVRRVRSGILAAFGRDEVSRAEAGVLRRVRVRLRTQLREQPGVSERPGT